MKKAAGKADSVAPAPGTTGSEGPIVVHGPVQGTAGRAPPPEPLPAPELLSAAPASTPLGEIRRRAAWAARTTEEPAPAAPSEAGIVARAARLAVLAAAPAPVAPPPEQAAEGAPGAPGTPGAPGRPAGTPASKSTDERRAHSLDALRGFFLILMTLGFAIYGESFPAWMYHRQMPPPTYEVVDMAGISWRDLAYGAFLFTMAAALPVTLSRRIAKGEVEAAIILAAIKRYFMLFVFGLLVAHSNLAVIGYGKKFRGIAIIGFVVMALIFTRRRKDWDPAEYTLVNRFGWLAAVLFLALTPLLYDSTFSFARNDDIIRGLAFASLTGSLIWYFTRENIPLRLIVLGFILALYLGSKGDGWVSTFWWTSPAEWLMKPADLTLLAIVIPGTIAGDTLRGWMSSPPAAAGSQPFSWNRARVALLGIICFAFGPVIVYGLYHRWVLATTQAVLVMIVVGFFLTLRPVTSSDRLLRQLFMWGSLWLLLGLLLEPSEGGIRKVPDTLSYLFTVTGITTMLLVAFSAASARPKPPAVLRPLLDVGTNPLLAYVLYIVFLNSVLEMVAPLRPFMRDSLEMSFLRTVISTVLVVLIVQVVTRKRIYWRT